MYKGVNTAVPTFFNDTGREEGPEVDLNAMEAHINSLILAGHASVVIGGTTGESPTLSFYDHEILIAKASEWAGGRIKIVAGVGSNSTQEALMMTEDAIDNGADALMVVVPYYNKPTKKGLREHFRLIREKAGDKIPICLYDIKGRTGIELSGKFIVELAKEGHVNSLKAASGNPEQENYVLENTAGDFLVLSGDDSRTLDLCKRGGHGVVSVLSNVMPLEMAKFLQFIQREEWDLAEECEKKLKPAMEAMFLETNPIPVKTALHLLNPNLFEKTFRLPMCPMEEQNEAKLIEVLESYGLL